MSELQTAGLIHTFEYTFELAWKTLKDYLEYEGVIALTPRQVIQEAFKANLITNAHSWIDALEKRNLMAHTYDQDQSTAAAQLIKFNYFAILKELVDFLNTKASRNLV